MDKPLCRLCGKRHSLSEPHAWATAEAMVDVIGRVVDPKPKEATPKKNPVSTVSPPPVPLGKAAKKIAVGLEEAIEIAGKCPVCAERRRKDAERVKRWREKKK